MVAVCIWVMVIKIDVVMANFTQVWAIIPFLYEVTDIVSFNEFPRQQSEWKYDNGRRQDVTY